MKDSVVRARALQLLDEKRSKDFVPFGAAEDAVPPPQGISVGDWLRALAQLAEYRLIDWRPIKDKSGTGRLGGFARINEFGIQVLNRAAIAPLLIALDETSRSTQPQLKQVTPEQEAITDALEKVINAIAHADESAEEKAKALSLMWKLLKSKAGADALGAGAQSLIAKYFAD